MRFFNALGAVALVATACGGVSNIGQGRDHLDGGPEAGGASPGGADGSGGASGTAAGGKAGSASGGRSNESGGKPGSASGGKPGNESGGMAGGSSTGGTPGGGCIAAQCAVPAICKQCADGSSACAQAACVNGACQTVFPPCPSVDAGSGAPCKLDTDCPQIQVACMTCADGSQACPFSKCVSGSCVSGIETCPPPDGLKWFATCGPPVCRDPSTPTGAPLCDPAKGEKVGGACSPQGSTCDPGTACSGNLLCATKDPRSSVGCPISRAKYKQEIEYLSEDERAKLAGDLQSIPLVRYRYKEGPEREHLGFIIEDVEPSPSVDSKRDQVDLYGYTSMAVAALQQQHAEIEALKREIRSLKAAVRARSKR